MLIKRRKCSARGKAAQISSLLEESDPWSLLNSLLKHLKKEGVSDLFPRNFQYFNFHSQESESLEAPFSQRITFLLGQSQLLSNHAYIAVTFLTSQSVASMASAFHTQEQGVSLPFPFANNPVSTA